jgi:hypothetical protein
MAPVHASEDKARKIFLNKSAWHAGDAGSESRVSVHQSMIQTAKIGTKALPYGWIIQFRGDYQSLQSEKQFKTQAEAKEGAWIYFKGRLLLEALTEEEGGSAKEDMIGE